jgi:hypothetical protein
MLRHDFITLLAGAAVWPLTTPGQPEWMRGEAVAIPQAAAINGHSVRNKLEWQAREATPQWFRRQSSAVGECGPA